VFREEESNFFFQVMSLAWYRSTIPGYENSNIYEKSDEVKLAEHGLVEPDDPAGLPLGQDEVMAFMGDGIPDPMRLPSRINAPEPVLIHDF
jgi:hypothetical protein